MSFFDKYKNIIALIAVTIAVLVVMGLSTIPTATAFVAENLVHTLAEPLQQGVMSIANGVGGFFNFIGELKSFQEENDRLAKELFRLQKQAKSTEDYKTENERLRKLLELKDGMPEIETVGARVIGRGPDNWFDYVIIDKGTKDGVAKKHIVITGQGLIGYVSEVGYGWAKVTTISDSSTSVGGIVNRTGDVAMVNGDVELTVKGLCKMTFIPRNSGIVQGDIIETSGLGGLYPKGIAIGRIEEIKADSSGAYQYAIVRPTVDTSGIKEVIVIRKFDGGTP